MPIYFLVLIKSSNLILRTLLLLSFIFKYGPTLAPFCIWLRGIYKQWQYTITINWTFPHCSVVFISMFSSQREGALDRYTPQVGTVHLRVPLTQTTVDMMSIFKASRAASKLEWVAMLKMLHVKNKSRKYKKLKSYTEKQTEILRVQLFRKYHYLVNWGKSSVQCRNQTHALDMMGVKNENILT